MGNPQQNYDKLAIIGYSFSLPSCQTDKELVELINTAGIGIETVDKEIYSKELLPSFYEDSSFRPIGGGPRDYKNFDASFFGYNPKDATYLDPQIRKSLEHAWLACEHAGYSPRNFKDPVGVYTVTSVNNYFYENLSHLFNQEADFHERTQMLYLNEADFLASRIAYHFNLIGPAFGIKSGCSSSMIAVHQACLGLKNFDCDIALVGGAAIKPTYQYGYLYEQDGILSENGCCAPFSDKANGTVFSNGVAFLVLKRLDDALECGDNIHAIILSTAVKNEGSDKVGYMAPSVSGQINVMLEALAFADIAPEDVSYIEAHGTGTTVGDPIEFEGLKNVFTSGSPNSIPINTVKANLGHLDALSGIVGILKVILEMKNKTISPLANFCKPNKNIDMTNTPFYFPTQLTTWESKSDKGRIAIISSFGVGGTNGTVLLQEYEKTEESPEVKDEYFIGLSAPNPDALLRQAELLQKAIELNPYLDLANLSYTLLSGRTVFSYKWGAIISNIDQLYQKLKCLNKEDISKINSTGSIELTNELLDNSKKTAELWMKGIQFSNLNTPLKGRKRIAIPGYSFSKNEYWIRPNEKTNKVERNEKITDISQWFYTPYWKKQRIPNLFPKLKGKKIIVLLFANYFSEKFVEKLVKMEAEIVTVTNGAKFNKKGTEYTIAPEKLDSYISLITELEKNKFHADWIVNLWNVCEEVSTFDEIQHLGIYSFMNICKAYAELSLTVDFNSVIVTENGVNISGTEKINPNKSTILGISQVLPKEYENVICNLIDIIPSFHLEETIKMILHEMANEKNSEIALRGRERFVKDYSRYILEKDKLSQSILSDNKIVLVIGGLGNFGLELAEFMSNEYNTRVFLTTRTEFPSRHEWDSWIEKHGEQNIVSKKIIQLKEFQKNKNLVEVLTGDVTSVEDMERINNYICRKYGKIDGIIHAAGTVDSGMIHTKTIESIEQVFAAKVIGTQNLCNIFLPSNPDFILLCSSMNSIIGGLGQIDNTAANAYIDAFAEFCHLQGNTNVLAINWGAVNEARARNYSALPQFKELSKEHIKNKMTKEEIFEVYRRLFSSYFGPRVVVSTLNFNKVIENWTRVGSLQSLVKKVDVVSKRRDEFVSIKFIEPITSFEKKVASYWQELLGIEKIGREDNFFELGGNSLVVIQLIGMLKKDYPIRMHAMSMYEYPTVREFAAYIEQLYKEFEDKKNINNKKK